MTRSGLCFRELQAVQALYTAGWDAPSSGDMVFDEADLLGGVASVALVDSCPSLFNFISRLFVRL